MKYYVTIDIITKIKCNYENGNEAKSNKERKRRIFDKKK